MSIEEIEEIFITELDNSVAIKKIKYCQGIGKSYAKENVGLRMDLFHKKYISIMNELLQTINNKLDSITDNIDLLELQLRKFEIETDIACKKVWIKTFVSQVNRGVQ